MQLVDVAFIRDGAVCLRLGETGEIKSKLKGKLEGKLLVLRLGSLGDCLS